MRISIHRNKPSKPGKKVLEHFKTVGDPKTNNDDLHVIYYSSLFVHIFPCFCAEWLRREVGRWGEADLQSVHFSAFYSLYSG